MKPNFGKRTLSLLLALFLCLGSTPLPVLAGSQEWLEAQWYDNNRMEDYGYGTNDGYVTTDANGGINLSVSGFVSVPSDCTIDGVWLVDASTKKQRYDLLKPSYGGENECQVFSYDNPDTNKTEYGLDIWIQHIAIPKVTLGDYRLKVITSKETYYSEAYSDEYFTTDGMVHIVEASDIVTPPEITTTVLPTGKVGLAYSAKVEAKAQYGGAISWSAPNLPAGLSINASTGVISGTPTQSGSFTFKVTASEKGGASAERFFTVTVDPVDPPKITTSSLPDGKVGAAYSASLAATPAITGKAITWKLQSGTLPAGLTLSSGGKLSGTPTAKGSYTFTIRASENGGGTADKSFTVAVTMDPPTVTTASLPDGMVDAEYSATLSAKPYISGKAISWSVYSGRLPSGLSLNADTGKITGKPEYPGTYNVTFKASEADGEYATKEFTVKIAQKPLELTDKPSVVLSYVGSDLLRRKGAYSIYLYLNRRLDSGETVTGVLNYTDESGSARSKDFKLTTYSYSSYAYCSGNIPEDAKSVESFEFSLNGEPAATAAVDLLIAPTLTISFAGEIISGASPYMRVKNAEGESVYSWYVNATDTPVILENIPAGEYTIEAEAYVRDYGNVEFGRAEATLTNGLNTKVTLTLTDHRAARIYPKVTVGDGKQLSWWAYGFRWYADAKCTQLLSEANSYSLLDDGVVYFKAVAKDSYSVYYVDSETVKITRTSDTDIEVPLVKKPTASVSISVQAENIRGGSYDDSNFLVALAKPGVDGYIKSTTDYGYSGQTFTADEITEGTVITVSARSGWSASENHAVYTHTVTAAEVAAGSLTLNLNIPLTEGRIYLDVTRTTVEGTVPGRFSDFNKFTLTASDGSELALRKTDSALVLLEPEKVNAGDTLTLYATYGDETFGPDWEGTSTLTVEKDAEGKKLVRGSLDLVKRRSVYLRLRRRNTGNMTLLFYNGDGSLLKADQEIFGGIRFTATNYDPWLGGLLPGSYTAVLVDSNYFDTLAYEDYDTVSEGRALKYSGYTTVSVADTQTAEATITLGADAMNTEVGNLNHELSQVKMTQTSGSLITIDMDIIPTTSFNSTEAATLILLTNQPQEFQGHGYVSTYSLSVNGAPVTIDRWNTNGIIQSDGSISLYLKKAEIEARGGFPMTFSTVIRQTEFESMSCSAYLQYYQNGRYTVEFIGSFEQQTGAITIEAPESVADGEFTVYGRGMPCTKEYQGYAADMKQDYNVTILANGMPVGTAKTDHKGNYKAKVAFDTSALEEYGEIEFIAVGAYDDGRFTRVSDPAYTLYTPNDGVLSKYELYWENSEGYAELGRINSIVIWDDGDPVSQNQYWYRSGGRNDKARVQWRATFDNPDEITAVCINVPRNGYTEVIDAVKQDDGTWLTPWTYFPGSAPDGAYVSYSAKTHPEHLEKAEDGDYTEEQLKSVYDRLASTSMISDLTVVGEDIHFKLKSGKKDIPVSITKSDLEWDDAELKELNALKPAFSYGDDEGDLSPNVVLYREGWFTAEDMDGFSGDEYIFGSQSIRRYDESFGTVYISTVMTATRRVVVTWDVANKHKEIGITDIGGNVLHNPAANGELDERIEAAGLSDENGVFVRNSGLAEKVTEMWSAFYTKLAEAFSEAASAEVSGKPITEKAVFAAEYKSAPVYEVYGSIGIPFWDAVSKEAEKLKKAKETGDDIAEWMNEIEVTGDEISKLHRFLKDNYCLQLLFKTYDSNGNTGPFDIVPEIKEKFGQRMTQEVVKALDNATSFGKDFGEKGIKAAWDKVKDEAKGYTYNQFKTRVREQAWGRESTNLGRRLYYAARYAEKYERNSNNGGLCSEGINWKNWPKDIYDPDAYINRDDRTREDALLRHYQNKILTPVNYNKQPAPSGPQGRYDPSGYVYEAVPSNRIEGATVTLYTLNGELNVTRDEYEAVTGISGGNLIIADPDEFGIEPNPQTTGEDGRYQWFVPEGWWRVKVSAEGYEDADTGSAAVYGTGAVYNSADRCWYMPVLPVQLDVNIPLVSYEAPKVKSVSATTLGVLVTFTKYMDEESLKDGYFTMLVNGEAKPFKVTFADSEKSSASEDAPSYTRTLLLTYEGAAEGDKIQLAIDSRVQSYAGVAMDERYDSGELTVTAPEQVKTPTADVAAGEVEKNTAVILSCETEGAVIRYTTDGSEPDDNSPIYNSAIIITEDVTVKAAAFKTGMLPSEVLTVSYTVPAETVTVIPAKVIATKDGAVVSDGDTLTPGYLTLTTETPGAKIYYTTNGICPRDDPNPTEYTGPIYLEPGTYFFRIRAFLDGQWSDGLPLHLTVTEAAVTYTVTFETNGGSAIEAQQVTEGGKAARPADPTKDGFTFAGWYQDAELTAEFDFDTPITADTVIYAKWTENAAQPVMYTITFDLNGGTLDGKTGTVTLQAEEGSTIKLPAPTREGYTFDHWEGSQYKAGDSYKVTGDHTFKAVWKENGNGSSDNPNTGFGAKALWTALMLISVIGLFAAFNVKKQRRARK